MMNDFASNLKVAIEDSLMTKAEICRRAGVSNNQLIMLLKGKSMPRLSTIGKLARALGVDARQLMYGKSEQA